jgi:hypothetical protein
MSFLPAVQREINNRQPNDPVRLTLEFLSQRGVGYQHSVPLADIVAHLQAQNVPISATGFQQTVLAASRDADYYIGSGNRGYFLIDTIDDARVMRDFYEARIQAEQQNLDNLRRQALQVGWHL